MKKPTSKTTTPATTASVEAPVATAATTKVKAPKAKAAKGNKPKVATAAKKKQIVFHKALTHKYGFSVSAARDTLTQLKALGLPTADVKKHLVQRFAEFVNGLDK